jgi:3,4-dihydroxy-9,10-secoandrosta-1,3,5(10)-triene-9,17-dione 4,5-dioxygenase
MTSLIAKLGYVGVTTPRFEEMRTWGPEVLGCMLGRTEPTALSA